MVVIRRYREGGNVIGRFCNDEFFLGGDKMGEVRVRKGTRKCVFCDFFGFLTILEDSLNGETEIPFHEDCLEKIASDPEAYSLEQIIIAIDLLAKMRIVKAERTGLVEEKRKLGIFLKKEYFKGVR